MSCLSLARKTLAGALVLALTTTLGALAARESGTSVPPAPPVPPAPEGAEEDARYYSPPVYPPRQSPAAEPARNKPAYVWSQSAGVEADTSVPTVMVNSRRIRLNYQVREVGPSGVASVELWATRDGRTWARYSNEPPPPGPLVVHVAEEGRYGFSLVVKSGTGHASQSPPKTGDRPQLWVEVDETKPAVRLHDVHIGQGPEHGLLTIQYSASDVQLTPRPVTIYTSINPDGPWAPIATGLENTGSHVWKMPEDVPYKFYVRVEVTDKAGNVGHDTTARPVVIDLAAPRGVILGVDGDHKESADGGR